MKECILHLRASNFVGGPEKQILQYTNCNFNGRVDIRIASFCNKYEGIDFLREASNRGIATLPLPADSFTGSIRALSEAIRKFKVRLLCVHGYKSAVLGAIASRLTGVPYVCFLRGWTRENRKVAVYENLERLCARFADRVVCLSETQATEVRRELDQSRVRVVVNAAKVRTYTPEQRHEARRQICALASFDPARPLVIAAGRLSPEKGTATLIRAAQILRPLRPDVQFAVFGDGVERERLEHWSYSLGLNRTVCFVGHRDNFTELIAGADLLVNPSLTEQMPNVVLEAMSAGVPVAATAVGGVPELARDDAIALVDPQDPNKLAEVIGDLIQNPSRRRTMHQKGWHRLLEGFSQEKQAEQLGSLYREFIVIGREGPAQSLPRISVVAPVRNEEQRITAILDSLRNQSYPPELVEIVVVDGMSTDRTPGLVVRYASQRGASIRLIENPGRVSSSGRNLGAAASTGDILLFVDGHCQIPSHNYFADMVRLFGDTGADVLCRPQPLDFPENTFLQKVIAAARSSWLGHGRDSTIYSTNLEGWVNPSSSGAIYRRSIFEKFGGFDERFDACEDVEFNYRLHRSGAKGYISPKLTVFYEPRKTLSDLFSQMVRYGKGRVRLVRKHPESFSLFQLMPAALALVALLGFILTFTSLRYPWFLLMGIYAGLITIESARIANRIGLASLSITPLTFFTIHAGLGAGLIFEWLKGERRLIPKVPEPALWRETRASERYTSSDASVAQHTGGK